MTDDVSEIFDPTAWTAVAGFEVLVDLTYEMDFVQGIVRFAL